MGTFLELLGIGASALLTMWGVSKEEEQQANLMKRHEYEYGEELGLGKERVALERRGQRLKEKEFNWKKEMTEEAQTYQRGQDMANRFIGILDRRPAFTNNLVSLWPKMRRAA